MPLYDVILVFDDDATVTYRFTAFSAATSPEPAADDIAARISLSPTGATIDGETHQVLGVGQYDATNFFDAINARDEGRGCENRTRGYGVFVIPLDEED